MGHGSRICPDNPGDMAVPGRGERLPARGGGGRGGRRVRGDRPQRLLSHVGRPQQGGRVRVLQPHLFPERHVASRSGRQGESGPLSVGGDKDRTGERLYLLRQLSGPGDIPCGRGDDTGVRIQERKRGAEAGQFARQGGLPSSRVGARRGGGVHGRVFEQQEEARCVDRRLVCDAEQDLRGTFPDAPGRRGGLAGGWPRDTCGY